MEFVYRLLGGVMDKEMKNVAEEKKRWRASAAALFDLLDREARREQDIALCEKLWHYADAMGANHVMAYAPLADEPDLMPFLRRWTNQGGCLILPVWMGGSDMALKQVENVDASLRPGRGGISEPHRGCADADPGQIDLCIVPGRFFSELGERLGRGAGCYDRLLSRQNVTMKTLGVAYDFQVVPRLPVDRHDRRMDAILTPGRIMEWSVNV